MLNREEILSRKDLRREQVDVPEWGGAVYVSEMTAAARDAWEQAIMVRDKNKNLLNPRAKLVIATVVDENGDRLFNDKDIDEVGQLSAVALDRVCTVSQRLNGLLAADLEDAKGN